MDEKTYLLKEIRACKRKLSLACILSSGMCGLAGGGLFGVLLEIIALFKPFYNVHIFACAAFLIGFFAGLLYAWVHRPNMEDAARRMDGFGLQERILTAYENRGNDSDMADWQRKDAAQCLKEQRGNIRIPIRPAARETGAFALAVCLAFGVAFFPSQAKQEAKEMHAVSAEAKELSEQLAEVQKQLEETDANTLSDEEQEELQELLESLARSKEELAQAKSTEDLEAAKQTLAYKYEQASAYTGTEVLAGEMADQLQSGYSDEAGTENGGINGSESAGGKNKDGSDGAAGNGTGEKSGDSDRTGEGEGDGSSSGTGEGDESGFGSGDGSGSGEGSGSGRGIGSSQKVHDYVSVPNDVGDDGSIASDKGDSADSDYYKAQNGLAWTGDHVSLDSVIGDYTKKAYEGLDSGKYPSGMEDVIRTYFESLN